METLIRYATEDEVNAFREKYREVITAKNEERRITEAIARVDADLNNCARLFGVDAANAARRALGEPVLAGGPAFAAPTLDRADLQAQLTGLKTRQHEAFLTVQHSEHTFTREKRDLIRTCAERAAEDYTKAAQQLGWCWEAIAAAERLAGGRAGPISPYSVWDKLSIPGGDYLPALKKASHTEWGAPMLLSAETLSQRAGIAADLVEAHVRELVGG